MHNFTAELVGVGNEILEGETQDTNSHYLCTKLNENNIEVTRITTVPDDLETISSVIKLAVKGKANFLFLSGGLGPTPDDITIQALSKAVRRKLEINEGAIAQVKRAYLRKRLEYTRERILDREELAKIVRLPSGTIALPNNEGTAPGIMLELKETTIFALAGVPAELRDVFENQIIPILSEREPSRKYYVKLLKVKHAKEAVLAPLIISTMKKYDVSIGSYPQKGSVKFRFKIPLKYNVSEASQIVSEFEKEAKKILKVESG
jgi:nicotinamide-nucleotide amidase